MKTDGAWRLMACLVFAPLLPQAAGAQGASSGVQIANPTTAPAAVGRVCEFIVPVAGAVDNPFDPKAASLEAEFTAPSGKRVATPGFYMVPHRPVVVAPVENRAKAMRVFFNVGNLPPDRHVEFLLDGLRLVDRDKNETVIIDDFEGPLKWKEEGSALGLEEKEAKSGRRSLRVSIDTAEDKKWPGMRLELGAADWRRFAEMRLWIRLGSGPRPDSIGLEFYTPEGAKIQKSFPLAEYPADKWSEVVWSFPPQRETIRFEPSGAPQWRARLLPMEAGAWCAHFVWKGNGAPQEWDLSFNVAPGKSDGLIRVSPRDPRFLEFVSGRPFFAIGTNLLGNEIGQYRYYLDRLAANGGNYIRIWLSPRTMGIELEGYRYDQARAAQLDALFDLCRERGIYVMVCLTDFREIDTKNEGSYWPQSPFNAAKGGACETALDFFTADAAREQYRRKLRYIVARWAACPNVLAWEFFNEVNISDGWRKDPQLVRDWTAQMTPFLKNLDPYGHLVTSSFAGLEDDALWEQGGMEIAQRHFYLDPGESFVDMATTSAAALARHRKPALVGEFGRSKNRYATIDTAGASLHEGIWASALSGACGTAMTWWWQWIDDNGLWRQFADLAEFLKGVDWPGEKFAPLEADIEAKPDPKVGFGRLAVSPRKGGFQPAPFNKPVAVTLKPDGVDRPDLLARYLHGTRNHPEYHNPVTFVADYKQTGDFGVTVSTVSRYGGAGLLIFVDGNVVLRKDLPAEEQTTGTLGAAGASATLTRYSVPIAAGHHAIKVENPGADWLVVTRYDFTGAQTAPPVDFVGLRGQRTALVWLHNRTASWDQLILETPKARLTDVRAALRGLAPGAWRVRPFDPWTGKWGETRNASVGADGRLPLSAAQLDADAAWRLERVR